MEFCSVLASALALCSVSSTMRKTGRAWMSRLFAFGFASLQCEIAVLCLVQVLYPPHPES